MNSPPVAVDDSFVATEETPLSIAAPGVLANDQDSDNDKMTAAVVTQPGHGSLVLKADGSFVYVPFGNYSGPDSFTYKANDNQADSNIATVSLVVNFVADGSATSRLLVDIDKKPAGIGLPNINGLTLMAGGGLLYFSYDDQEQGLALWRTDGTGSGTSRVTDLPALVIAEVNGTVFLNAFDAIHGSELWRTDGTTAGTQMVRDIRPGGGSSFPSLGTNVNGTLFFRANDGVHGYELWKSDGTAAGTMMVKDIGAGPVSSDPQNLANANGTLYFFANGGLWKSDGTDAGTVEIGQNVIPEGGPPVAVGGSVYFAGLDSSTGVELWKIDGTASDAVLVKDIAPGLAGSGPSYLINVAGTLFFLANDGIHGYELWKSDGTEAGTELVRDTRPGSATSSSTRLTQVGGTLFFMANDGSHGRELWKADGTSSGATLVKDINPGSGDGAPFSLTNVNGELFFVADDNVHGYELWKSDGTDAGTVLVKDILTGTFNYSHPSQLTNAGGTLFFRDKGSTPGLSVWKSDGTTAGTVEVPRDAVSTQEAFPYVFESAFVGSTLCVETQDGELWKTDGTAAGTSMVAPVSAEEMTNVNGTIFFRGYSTASGVELWKSDGTTSGTAIVKDIRAVGGSYPKSLANINGTLMFVANDGTGYQLWMSDGTLNGTVKFSGLRVRGDFSNVRPFIEMNGALYFSGNDGTHGYELWKTDGTTAGTVMVTDLLPDATSSGGVPFANVNGVLFFGAKSELWKTDGTAAGTVRVASEYPVWNSATQRAPFYASVNGVLFFQAYDSIHGAELWRSDGTGAGTVLIKDTQPGANNWGPEQFYNVNGVLMFVEYDGRGSFDLWKSDGTEAGTVIVRPSAGWNTNVYPPRPLAVVNGTLYLAANDGVNGVELWHTDGTTAGTYQINIRPGPQHSAPNAVFEWNGNVIVSANDGVYGHELRTLVDVSGAPSGANKTVTVVEDTAFTFRDVDFGFSDPRDTPPNVWTDVVIVSAPSAAAGKLTLAGTQLKGGEIIAIADIRTGKLQFVPTANFNSSGGGPASFTFKVKDDGGTANGGGDTDLTPRTMKIDVTPVNDPPRGTDLSLTMVVGRPHVFTVDEFGFSDPDDSPPNQFAAIHIYFASPELTYNGQPVGEQVVPVVDIKAGKLVLQSWTFWSYNAGFSFSVIDDGGTANGGKDVDPLNIYSVSAQLADVAGAVDDDFDALEDQAMFADMAANDFVNPGPAPVRPIVPSVVSGPAHGSLTLHTSYVFPYGNLPDGYFLYVPNANFNGDDSFTYSVAAFGPDATVTIHVAAVNDRPTFVKGPDLDVLDDAGAQSLVGWATGMSVGPPDEANQLAQFVVQSNTDTSLFDVQPMVDAAGKLTFTPKLGASGSAQIVIVLADDGGTALGGADTSQPQTFSIDVNYDHPWHNRVTALDVDGDTHIAPNDAVDVINFINAFGSQAVPKNGTAAGPFYDVNGDGFVAPNDVVEVINRINATGGGGEGEAGGGQRINPAGTIADDVITLLAADGAVQGKRRP